MRDFRIGDTIWTKNPRADMNNVYHDIVVSFELRIYLNGGEIFWKTLNHGWVSEHLAAHTREEALKLSQERPYEKLV